MLEPADEFGPGLLRLRNSFTQSTAERGRIRLPGRVVFLASTGEHSEFLHAVVVFAVCEIDDFVGIIVNRHSEIPLVAPGLRGIDGRDRAGGAYQGTVRIHTHNGTQREADPTLIEEFPGRWTPSHRLLGISYASLRIRYDRFAINAFSGASAVVRANEPTDRGLEYVDETGSAEVPWPSLAYLRTAGGVAQ